MDDLPEQPLPLPVEKRQFILAVADVFQQHAEVSGFLTGAHQLPALLHRGGPADRDCGVFVRPHGGDGNPAVRNPCGADQYGGEIVPRRQPAVILIAVGRDPSLLLNRLHPLADAVFIQGTDGWNIYVRNLQKGFQHKRPPSAADADDPHGKALRLLQWTPSSRNDFVFNYYTRFI